MLSHLYKCVKNKLPTPQKNITAIGLLLNLRRVKNAMENKRREIQSALVNPIDFVPKATCCKMETPAEAINATTTGRSLPSTCRKPSSAL